MSEEDNGVTTRLISVRKFAEICGWGMTKAWQAIGANHVVVVRHGRRTMVRVDSLNALIEAMSSDPGSR